MACNQMGSRNTSIRRCCRESRVGRGAGAADLGRSAIPAGEPKALQKLGLSPDHWTRQVKGVGSDYWVVGAAAAIEEKAVAMQQQFLRGIGFARALATS